MTTPGNRGWSRRQVLACAAGAFVVAGLPALRSRAARRVSRRTLPLMGTLAEVTVVHDDRALAGRALDAAFAELGRVERLLTRFTGHSDVGRANSEAARRSVDVGPDAWVVLVAAQRWAERTDGAFDPCLGAAVQLWDVTHRHAPPPQERVAALAGRRLYRSLDLTATAVGGRVRFADADVSLDLGGIGKGYAVDKAVEVLRAAGVTRGFVNVGGDLVALGASEDGDPWRVGVRDPNDPRGLLGTLELCDAAVATSGDAEQAFEYEGRRYHHLLDPATGAPRCSPVRSLSVQATTCMEADAAATACFGREAELSARCLSRWVPGARLLG